MLRPGLFRSETIYKWFLENPRKNDTESLKTLNQTHSAFNCCHLRQLFYIWKALLAHQWTEIVSSFSPSRILLMYKDNVLRLTGDWVFFFISMLCDSIAETQMKVWSLVHFSHLNFQTWWEKKLSFHQSCPSLFFKLVFLSDENNFLVFCWNMTTIHLIQLNDYRETFYPNRETLNGRANAVVLCKIFWALFFPHRKNCVVHLFWSAHFWAVK